MIRFLFLTFILCAAAYPAAAQTPKKLPIEVTAQKTLEWDRNNKTFIAREKAIATQGKTELHGDILTAKYTEGKNGKSGGMTINRIDATGNVIVVSDGSRATGSVGYYDVKTGYAQLTGDNLKLTTKTDTVTARDKLTYEGATREMNAWGNARAVRPTQGGEDVITADRLIGRFKPDANGNNKMDEMEAIGSVVITTPTEILHGDHAIYYATPNTATVTGHVRIDRGPNVITGARGEIDLNTNISKIYGGAPSQTPSSVVPDEADQFLEPHGTDNQPVPSNDGRVRGVFYPDN
jgi:lipopolysaccharide export system protein LptA